MSRDRPYLGFECDPDLKEAVRREAERDGRTLSSWLRHVVRRTLEVRRRVFEGDEEPRAEQTA